VTTDSPIDDLSGLDPASVVVSAGRPVTPGDPLNTPIVPASNFTLGGDRDYARASGTATWSAFEEIVGALEGGTSMVFASGMAAISAVFDLLPAGASVALPAGCYQGVAAVAAAGEAAGRWRLHHVPVTETGEWVAAAGEVDLVWLESPSNPLLEVADLVTICAAPRRPGAIVAVDNTFATPLNQRPLELGADISVQSATKFLGGHSDLLAGVLSARDELTERLRDRRMLGGAAPGALEAFLATRGLRTLAVRFDRAQVNAEVVAMRLDAHPAVRVVRFPGLVGHPTHAVAAAQLDGFGTMISFDVADAAAAEKVCQSVRLIHHATSLGAVESTMERRGAVPGQGHLPPGLLRLSVGIEDVEDLWTDLSQALETATST
jgi:cystathionine gamma-synthase